LAPKPFDDWQVTFKKKPAFIAGTKATPSHKRAVAEVLADIDGVPLVRGTHTVLRHNALFACYSAQYALHPSADEAANDRARLRAGHKALSQHAETVSRVLDFATKHRAMAEKAMSCSTAPNASTINPDALAEVEQLVTELSRYAVGLKAVMDVDHPIHITPSDFRYGPFELSVPIETWRFKLKGVNQLGLMFHLVYVCRYFTCQQLPDGIEARFDDETGLLDFYGRMLDCGEPHTDLVAPLVNAVFNTKFSALKVRDRLNDLTRKSKGSRFPHWPRFVGWPSLK
jgi:hypothetical protein